MAETPSGMLNAVGLQNKGVDYFEKSIYPVIENYDTHIIVNINGSYIDDYVALASRMNQLERIPAIELNISCPNVDRGGIEFGADPVMTEKTLTESKKVFPRPIIAKLGPMVTDIVVIAKAAEQGGADALAIMNSAYGTAVDIETWRPRLTNNRGGLTGPAIKPIALAMVDAVYQKCRLPIIGIGGICNATDALEFILAGATAVQVGTANFINPGIAEKIAHDMERYLLEHRIADVKELIGALET